MNFAVLTLPPTFQNPTMVDVIICNGEENAHIQHLQCKPKPIAALLKHSEAAALPSQQEILCCRACKACSRDTGCF